MENCTNANEGKMTPDEFFKELILRFPTLREQILEDEPIMTHPRMETFASYTIEQIKNKNWDELKRCFEFQESKIDSANSDLLK